MVQPSAAASLTQRRLMVDGQIRTFGVTDLDLIDRFLDVPREDFVGDGQQALVYSDAPIHLPGHPRRTLLRPMVLAKMLQATNIRATDRVLDVGGGLGYTAALVSGLANAILTVESDASRSRAGAAACMRLGLANITFATSALNQPASASPAYDVIIINGAVSAFLERFLDQLADGGRLVAIRMPPGSRVGQAICVERHNKSFGERVLFETSAAMLEGFHAQPAFTF